MSGTQEECSCLNNHCLGGNCLCFKAKQFCSLGCTCIGCQNTEENKALVDSQYELYLKRKAPVVDEYLSVPPGGFPAPEGFVGCRCKKTKCMRQCGCLRRFAKCTSKCTCQDCANRGSDKKTERGQVDGNSSIAEEPAQMQEQPTQSGDNSGSGQNKRPRTGD
ncbi:protein tesmin/TSO1-like CXC 7 [Lolium rigidum]|uniref:protein tesmin/TSO1-like CXC 7 n=1 Tax=Lolium rigidum TaxID=89674 RepID=UPI001F5D4A73|nr:protein tesmin/TSO1-like CXC 7 [Lolium rigidum]